MSAPTSFGANTGSDDSIGTSGMNQGYNDEPINGAQHSDSENSKEILVDKHFYNNFGDIFYEDALKDIMVETLDAGRESKKKKEESA